MTKERGKYGSNMIKVTVRFWTNNVGTRDKKVAWESGVAYLNANKHRDIKPKMERFDRLEDMEKAIRTALKKGQIKLKPNPKNYMNL